MRKENDFDSLMAIAVLVLLSLNSCVIANRAFPEDKSCEVHDHRLKRTIVQISYGRAFPRTIRDSVLFPFPKPAIGGGCIIRQQKFAIVKYCGKCERVKKSIQKLS